MATFTGKNALGKFSVYIKQVAKAVPITSNNTIKQLALTIDQAVVLSTPVDTGRARSNWRVGIDNKPDGQIPPYAPGDHLGRGEANNAAAAIAQAKGEILRRQPEQTIYISNNVDYIGVLNSPDTRSVQAPPFFVQRAIKAALAELKLKKLIGSFQITTGGL
jgi:hypothetical protein